MWASIQSVISRSATLRLMRADKPAGTWLLMWPCWWSVAMAYDGIPSLDLFFWFFLGAFAMRSAGCIVNDLVDRDIDAKVARTQSRPLASGELTPYDALTRIAFLLAVSLFVVMQLHPHLLYWAAGSLLLVAAYPFMKRITWWPQLFLGLTFNLGALFGWVAIHGSIDCPAIVLYLGCIAWTVGYDTIYAHQDIEDDMAIGVKSTAILFGEYTKSAVAACYCFTACAFIAAGILLNYGWVYFACLSLCIAHLGWQIFTLKITSASNCLVRFKSNQWLGAILFLSIMAEKFAII